MGSDSCIFQDTIRNFRDLEVLGTSVAGSTVFFPFTGLGEIGSELGNRVCKRARTPDCGPGTEPLDVKDTLRRSDKAHAPRTLSVGFEAFEGISFLGSTSEVDMTV